MKSTRNRMVVHLDLENNFLATVEEAMEDEFDLACKRWKVRLNGEDHDVVMKHSLSQLRRKVTEVAKANWDLSDRLNVRVVSPRPDMELTLPNPKAHSSSTRFIFVRDGWEVDDERREESVRISDFRDHMQRSILDWARTAVFYGVGSYVL